MALAGLCWAAAALAPLPAGAFSETALEKTVSVLPVWPGKPQGGTGAPTGAAPEGTGISIAPGGLIATAYHVIEPAERIDVRLADGRIFGAEVLGADPSSDIALLRIPVDLPVFETSPDVPLASQACIIGNAYGLDLSVTCGVVSALNVSRAGFNPVEDFVQTDAAANPGSSGGALVDAEGRLIGMVSAIFAARADTNIGVNFAVSSPLLLRVVEDLRASGSVSYVSPGWGLDVLTREDLQKRAGVAIVRLDPDGPAARAGLQTGDQLTRIGTRSVRDPRDVLSALAAVRPGEAVDVRYFRRDAARDTTLTFSGSVEADSQAPATSDDCPYSAEICRVRQAVFPIQGYDPLASSTRIGDRLLVTNRHVVADQRTVTVFTPNGPLEGKVIASGFTGDLALIEVEGLPADGLVLKVIGRDTGDGPFHAVGADIAQRQVRVFPPGELIAEPAPEAPLGRLHVTSVMQPGVSGGALVDGEGHLAGIAVGGGEGRFEAIALDDVADLVLRRGAPDAEAVFDRLGKALAACHAALDTLPVDQPGTNADAPVAEVVSQCAAADNPGQLLEAGQMLGRLGHVDEAIILQEQAVRQVPHSINARLSLMVSLQLNRRFGDMVLHARKAFELAPDDALVLRRAVQAGVLGNAGDLANAAVAAMEAAGLPEAARARQFVEQRTGNSRP